MGMETGAVLLYSTRSRAKMGPEMASLLGPPSEHAAHTLCLMPRMSLE